MLAKIDTRGMSQRFLSEALPLISSYLSGSQVDIGIHSINIGEEHEDDLVKFSDMVRIRHAIACCSELSKIFYNIETSISRSNRVIRDETRGVIRGRLDIPRYIARRTANLSWPRTYPILATEKSSETPENLLLVHVLKRVLRLLNESILDKNSAEYREMLRCRHWISACLHQEPWSKLSSGTSIRRLWLETSRRVARRQTGNEKAYDALLRFVSEWHLFGDELGGKPDPNKLIQALFAFPSDEAFLDRIFEIWCLSEVVAVLQIAGCNLVDGPLPLTSRRKSAIYYLSIGEHSVEVWFQKSIGPTLSQWSYYESRTSLRGIPDISVVVDGNHWLIVDAKNRNITSNTRSEETYKMLGYFENFALKLDKPSCWAILAFISYKGISNTLISNNGQRIIIASAHPEEALACKFRGCIESGIREWIKSWNTS